MVKTICGQFQKWSLLRESMGFKNEDKKVSTKERPLHFRTLVFCWFPTKFFLVNVNENQCYSSPETWGIDRLSEHTNMYVHLSLKNNVSFLVRNDSFNSTVFSASGRRVSRLKQGKLKSFKSGRNIICLIDDNVHHSRKRELLG